MALAASPISIEHGHGGEDRPVVLSYDPRSSQLETSRLDHVAEDEQSTMAVPINARDVRAGCVQSQVKPYGKR